MRRSTRLSDTSSGNSASGGPSAADVKEVTRPRTQGLKRIVADDKSTLSTVENKVEKKAKRARLPSAQGSELVASRSHSLVSGAPGTKGSETKGRQKKRPQDVPKADQVDVKNNVEEKLEKQTKGRQKKRPQDAPKSNPAEGQTNAESTQGGKPEALESLHSAASGKHPMPDRKMEFALWEKGFTCVAGVDEAGRGPLAGPVVAAACVLPKDADASLLCGIADSKDVKEEAREAIYERLVNHPGVRYAIGVRDHSAIDRVNILQATMQAMKEAVQCLPSDTNASYVLVDGNRCPTDLGLPCTAVVGGDAKVTAIAAASIIAKVTRDRIMQELDKEYPQYLFAQHKGYGTAKHRELIHLHGPCEVHRRSFNPTKTILKWTPPEGY